MAGLPYSAALAPARPQLAGQVSFQLRIELEEIEPPVWRRLLVPGGFALARLHDVLQAAMGWSNSHLHCFSIGGERYGMILEEEDEDLYEDEAKLTVRAALGGNKRFSYEYDLGDSWEYDVTVEETMSGHLGLERAVCLGGENACRRTVAAPEDTRSCWRPSLPLPTRSTTTSWRGSAVRSTLRRSISWP